MGSFATDTLTLLKLAGVAAELGRYADVDAAVQVAVVLYRVEMRDPGMELAHEIVAGAVGVHGWAAEVAFVAFAASEACA